MSAIRRGYWGWALAAVLVLIAPASQALAGSRPGVSGAVPTGPPVYSVGTVAAVTWGADLSGQLGSPNPSKPLNLVNLPGGAATAVAAGRDFTLVLLGDGTILGWGANEHGQLGDGTQQDRAAPVHVLTASGAPISNVVAIAAGAEHGLAITSDGRVWAWGDNSSGQLGDGTTVSRSVAAPVAGLTNAWEVEAGDGFSLAVTRDAPRSGLLWAWGRNDRGQLGDGTIAAASLPQPVPDPSTPGAVMTAAVSFGQFDHQSVAAGEAHVLVIRPDGTVWSWGDNGAGQLGDGSTVSRGTPAPVPNLTGAISVAAGAAFSLALVSGETVWAWGDDTFGQLGDGGSTAQTTPQQVATPSSVGIVALAVGSDFALALANDGTVWTWGDNHDGQLGTDAGAPNSTPSQVSGLSDVVQIGAGRQHAIALVRFAPDTSASLSPRPYSTLHYASVWNSGPVTVTLTGTANPLGPPVATTYYAIDDIKCDPTALSHCMVYNGPFTISQPGQYYVFFFSVDRLGDTAGQQAATVNIDTTPPQVTLTAPQNGATYLLHQQVPADYTCTDDLSGILSCSGSVLWDNPSATIPSGSNVEMATPGLKLFLVAAVDSAGNGTYAEAAYRVTFAVCQVSSHRRGKGAGAVLVIRLALCDAAGTDVSSRAIVLTVAPVSPRRAGALHGRFQYHPGAAGASGTYTFAVPLTGSPPRGLRFRATGDPVQHSVPITVR